ncbi:hypothetical protein [Actinoplanes sp. TBRC 11911]|uniref:hypothetical protein n=1 Tax=Actinoplanes sp. TBRC 11911 TaxID=2729386 RepID=UPI001B7D4E97|nr:hypothetical protein [Actinoplanes sp. TBRC 11911]
MYLPGHIHQYADTNCIHEHSCVRCPLLRIDPGQRHRLVEIRDNLTARIAEAEREGWLGDAEGLRVSLAAAKEKLAQTDITVQRRTTAVELGMPAFPKIAARTITAPAPGTAGADAAHLP